MTQPLLAQEPHLTVRPFSGRAVAAFVLSLLWLGGLGSLAAIFLAAEALRRIRRFGQAGQGLAVTALILGILGFLSAALFAGWAGVRVAQEGNQLGAALDRTSQTLSTPPPDPIETPISVDPTPTPAVSTPAYPGENQQGYIRAVRRIYPAYGDDFVGQMDNDTLISMGETTCEVESTALSPAQIRAAIKSLGSSPEARNVLIPDAFKYICPKTHIQ